MRPQTEVTQMAQRDSYKTSGGGCGVRGGWDETLKGAQKHAAKHN